ncbi:unnamed protein product [Lota lota]
MFLPIRYGLILPQKKALTKTATLQRPSVFGDDSDDETSVGESLQKEAVKKRMMKQTRLEMQKALEEDSTVYDYDGVYDDIQNQRLESSKKILGGADRKPKYINQLMKAVEERKKEQERRDERKIQKEREAEGEEFADKEAYVTAAYRQKLKERQEEQEKEKRDAAMEAALDVKKQKDLSGFYRHLLNQTVGEEAIPDHTADRSVNSRSHDHKSTSVPPPAPDTTSADPLSPSGDNGARLHSDSEDGHESKPGFSKPGHSSGHSKRHYRQRSASPGSGDERGRDKGKDRERHRKSQRDGERDRRKDRDGEREDRPRGRREDKDRRKDRAGEPERDSGQHRGREDRQERREKSPKERRREEEEEKRRGKRGSPLEQQQQKEKERMKDLETDRAIKPEAADKEGGGEETQKGSTEKQGGDGGSQGEERGSKFAKRSSDHTVSSARERYLARQMARSKAYIEKEED